VQHGGQAEELRLPGLANAKASADETGGGLFLLGVWDPSRFRQTWGSGLAPQELGQPETGLAPGRSPTSMPPIKANENMAWFIFDTFIGGVSQISR
jgi:hypothetical protein